MMIKAKVNDLIILGLSDENLKRLKNNEPIRFSGSEVGLPEVDILIFNGKTEKEMAELLMKKCNYKSN